jgi:hypothetical protein
MKVMTILAHSAPPVHVGWLWAFAALVLLILFVMLVASDGSKDN